MRRLALLAIALGLTAAATADSVYLALGDSIAFGLQPDPGSLTGYNAPSDADRYYVRDIANAIGAVDGSLPTVVNLAIPGESSVSFGDLSNVFRGANTNYGPNPFAPRMVTQLDFALEQIATYGGSITTVSFAIGANDFLQLDGTLQTDPVALQAAFASIADRYATFLGTVRAQLPNARLILPGYFNPYAAGDAKHDDAESVIGQLNATIRAFATTYDGRYVDFYSPIDGHQDTLIYTGDIHPNDGGYAALGRAAVGAVPEPASMAALALGALATLRRKRR